VFLISIIFDVLSSQRWFHFHLTYASALPWKKSKAINGKFCLKFQILLMLQWLNWYLIENYRVNVKFQYYSDVLLYAVSADASSNQTCRVNKTALRHIAPAHHPSAAAGDTGLHRSWLLAAKQSRWDLGSCAAAYMYTVRHKIAPNCWCLQ